MWGISSSFVGVYSLLVHSGYSFTPSVIGRLSLLAAKQVLPRGRRRSIVRVTALSFSLDKGNNKTSLRPIWSISLSALENTVVLEWKEEEKGERGRSYI